MTGPAPEATFLFTDIVGSTPRWEADPEGMAAALARHDDVLQRAITDCGGRVFKHTGDGFAAIFDAPGPAVAAALAGQLGLALAFADTDPLEVRMGLDCGAAQARAGDYFGPVVNRAARVMSAGGAAQIVVSEACVRQCATLPPGASFVDLGRHRLKGVSTPLQLSGLVHPDLPRSDTPLRTLNAGAGNLPPRGSGTVGREDERDSVAAALVDGPFVTIVGPGGVGKTHLALDAAHSLRSRFPDGIWFVDLSTVVDGEDLAEAVGAAVGVQRRQGETMTETLHDALGTRESLLVLDNCEHVVTDCARLLPLIATGGAIRVLATSREPLQIAGEQRIRLAPLTLDDARELFVARAQALDATFSLDEATDPTLTQICERLDGLPLAIELAAARLGSLSIDAIARRLEAGLALLRTSAPATSPRQRALQATLEWSHELLDADERIVFARSAVFRGSFDLEAIESVVAAHSSSIDTFDVVDRLVTKSMVHAAGSTPTGEPRYRLLRPVAEFAADQLTHGDDLVDARDAHASHYRSLAARAAPKLVSDDEIEWIATLDADLGNLHAALEHLDAADPAAGLAMAVDLYSFWIDHDLLHDGLRWLTADDSGPPALVAEALGYAAVLAFFLGENELAQAHALASRAICTEASLPFRFPTSVVLASLRLNEARVDEAVELCRTTIDEVRGVDSADAATALAALAAVLSLSGREDDAVALAREALAANRKYGPGRRTSALANLALTLQRADPQEAAAISREAVELATELGSRYFEAFALLHLGFASRGIHDDAGALRALADSLPPLRQVGLRNDVATVLEQIARMSVSTMPSESVTLYAAVARLREAVRLAGLPGTQRARERALSRLRDALTATEFDAAWDAGTALTLDAAVDFGGTVAEAMLALLEP